MGPRGKNHNHGNRERRGYRESGNNTRSQSFKRQRTDDSNSSSIGEFIENIAKDETSIQTLVCELLKNDIIKKVLVDTFQSEVVDKLLGKIDSLEDRLEEMEQYSRRTCLKFCGIPESEGYDENTDKLVLDVINKDILNDSDVKLSLHHIGRSHRLGTKKQGQTRNIIVRFIN